MQLIIGIEGRSFAYKLLMEIGAVSTTDVASNKLSTTTVNNRMPSRNGDIIKTNITLRVTADSY